MGYTLSVMPMSPALGKKMLRFMAQHYRPWPAVAGSNSAQYAGNPSDDLSYDRKKGVVGLDYGPVSGWEREYAYAIVKWMALKVGLKSSRYDKDEINPNQFETPYPYIMYDGLQRWPVITVSSLRELAQIPKSVRWCCTDTLGRKVEPHRMIANVLFDLPTDPLRLLKEAEKAAGPLYEGKHKEWAERRDKAAYRLCRKQFAATFQLMGDELQRLDSLWGVDS